jgi:hypothetical protein
VTHCFKVRFLSLKLLSEKTHVLQKVTQGHYVTTIIVKLANKAASHPINLKIQLLLSDSLKYRMMKSNRIKMLRCSSPLLALYFFFEFSRSYYFTGNVRHNKYSALNRKMRLRLL